MNMKQKSKNIFDFNSTMTMMSFESLHLGYFFSHMSGVKDLSSLAEDLYMETGAKKFTLKKDIIESSLSNMYGRGSLPDFFSYFIYINSVRSMSIYMMEMLKEYEIEKLFVKNIFFNDKNLYEDFHQILRFMRNVFAHMARDRLELKKTDYEDQARKHPIINFYFEYDKVFPNHIYRVENIIEINIKFSSIRQGSIYTDIISDYETILFIKLCHDCIGYLKEIMILEDLSIIALGNDLLDTNMLNSKTFNNFANEKGFESLEKYIEYLLDQIGNGITLELYNRLNDYGIFKTENKAL